MRKSLILMLITSLIMGVFLVSCNSEVSGVSSTGDKLVKVSIAGDNKGISAVGVADNGEDYYWYYKATKTNGGIYITGQTDWKAVKDGKGLKGTNLGYFSAGSWTFEFRAFATATSSYDTGYRYYTSVNVELNDDKSLELTMSGNGLANALLVFPSDLNWGYTPVENSSATVTLSTLGGRKAYMKVYAKAASAETEVLIAKSTKSDITANGSSATAVFGDFTGINNETDVRLASGEYTLIFKVFVTESSTADPSDNDQQVGEEKALSVTAYLGGVINITKSDSGYAVSDNESGANIVIDSVYNPVSKTSEATIAAAAIPNAPTAPEQDGKAVREQNSVATTITTSATAVAVEDTKKSTVSIPDAALAKSKVTVEFNGNNEVTKTTTESSTHTLSMEVVTENVDTSGTSFEIAVDSIPAVGINLDLTKITTKITQETGQEPSTETGPEVSVSDFDGKYITIATYIQPNLENVQVGYNGNAEQPKFDTANSNPSVALASGDATESNNGTGYNPETGLLVFKTNHFSSFFVTRKADAKIVHDNTDVYYQTLVDAVEDLSDGDTIVVMRNLDFSTSDYSGYKWAGSVYNPLEICVNNVTLDLGGHTISNMGNCAIAFGHLLAKDGRVSNVKIKNGTLSAGTTNNVTNSYVLLIAGADSAVIENVTTTGGINVCSGSTGVVIDSCNITGTKYYTVCSQTGSQVTIQGTSYTKNTDNTVANKSMFWIQGASTDSDMVTPSNTTGAFGASSITIASGEFTVDETNGGVFYLISGVKPVVKGGTYNINPTAYLADGYNAAENDPENGKWTVYALEEVKVSVPNEDDASMTLSAFRDAWNLGTFEGKSVTIKLLQDVNISGENWYPIGTWEFPFNGTFDGCNHSITGLSAENGLYANNSTVGFGEAYGFFGIVGGGNTTVQNVIFTSVNIDIASTGKNVGAVIGYAPSNSKFVAATNATGVDSMVNIEPYASSSSFAGKWNSNTEVGTHAITISNVTVYSGSIKGKSAVGGIAGKLYTSGKVEVLNCTNNANITGGSNTSGIVGYIHYSSDITVSACHNTGDIVLTGGAGIVNFNDLGNKKITNNSNSGKIIFNDSYSKTSSNSYSWDFIAGGVHNNRVYSEYHGNVNTGEFYIQNNVDPESTKGVLIVDTNETVTINSVSEYTDIVVNGTLNINAATSAYGCVWVDSTGIINVNAPLAVNGTQGTLNLKNSSLTVGENGSITAYYITVPENYAITNDGTIRITASTTDPNAASNGLKKSNLTVVNNGTFIAESNMFYGNNLNFTNNGTYRGNMLLTGNATVINTEYGTYHAHNGNGIDFRGGSGSFTNNSNTPFGEGFDGISIWVAGTYTVVGANAHLGSGVTNLNLAHDGNTWTATQK